MTASMTTAWGMREDPFGYISITSGTLAEASWMRFAFAEIFEDLEDLDDLCAQWA
jgi:hypothetical protein